MLFSKLRINASDWFGNILSTNVYHKAAWNKALREGEDRSRWYFKTFDTGMAVLLYWNQVVIPAGILQAPFYEYDMPHYYTFGSIGSILGHFLLHLIDEWGEDRDL